MKRSVPYVREQSLLKVSAKTECPLLSDTAFPFFCLFTFVCVFIPVNSVLRPYPYLNLVVFVVVERLVLFFRYETSIACGRVLL